MLYSKQKFKFSTASWENSDLPVYDLIGLFLWNLRFLRSESVDYAILLRIYDYAYLE